MTGAEMIAIAMRDALVGIECVCGPLQAHKDGSFSFVVESGKIGRKHERRITADETLVVTKL